MTDSPVTEAAFATYAVEGRVATVTLNRPQTRNAFASRRDCEDLVTALRRADADPAVSVVILAAEGEGFCSGGDLRGIRDRNGIGPLATPADTRDNYKRGVAQIALAFAEIEVATIAAVQGHAVGLGCGVAAYCDMRVAADDASFASSFVKLGIVPGDGEAWVLQRVIGYPRAAEMILTGDRVAAEQALAMGLVNAVVPRAGLMEAARALAARVAVNPPRTVRLSKRLLRQAQTASLAQTLELSAAFQALAHETADHREAVDAFVERRKPRFTGA